MLPLKTKPRYSADVRGRAPRFPRGLGEVARKERRRGVRELPRGRETRRVRRRVAPRRAVGPGGRDRGGILATEKDRRRRKKPRGWRFVAVWLDYVPVPSCGCRRAIAERMSTEPYVANDQRRRRAGETARAHQTGPRSKPAREARGLPGWRRRSYRSASCTRRSATSSRWTSRARGWSAGARIIENLARWRVGGARAQHRPEGR